MKQRTCLLTPGRNFARALVAGATLVLLSACSSQITALKRAAKVTTGAGGTPPAVASLVVTNTSPTRAIPLSLAWGVVDGEHEQYCILENSQDPNICVWLSGALPATYADSASDGPLVLTAYLRNDYGRSAAIDANSVTIDRTPAILASAVVTNSDPTNTTTYAINYGAVTHSYAEYCIRENSTAVAGCTWVAGSLPANFVVTSTPGAKTLTTWLRDVAGNVSSPVTTAAVTYDNSVPTVAFSTPAAASYVNAAAEAAFAVTGTCSENGQDVDISDDATDTDVCAANAWSVTLDVSALADGPFTLQADHANAAATPAVSATRSFVKDATLPAVALTAPNGGQLWAGGSAQTITWTATDANGVANSVALHYTTDGTTWTPIATGETNDGTYPWTLPSITSTTVRVRVTATDSAGNPASDASDAVLTIDSTAPVLASATVTNDSPTTVRGYVLEYGSVTGTYVEYCIRENNTAVGGCAWIAGTLPSVYTVTPAPGAKVLSIWLRDAAGNVSTRVDTNSVTYTPSLALSPTTWTAALSNTTAVLPAAPAGALSFTTNGGKIYLVGGFYDNVGGTSGLSSIANVWSFDPSNEHWTARAPMHERRYNTQGVLLSDGRIWMGGGLRWTSGSYAYLKTTEIYDPATDRWTKRKDLPLDRYRFAAARFTAADGTDRIAVIGGKQNAATTVPTLYIYNPANDTWKTGAPLSSARSDGTPVVLGDGRILVVGGLISGSETRTYSIYDPATDAWADGANSSATAHANAAGFFVPAADTGFAYDAVVVFGGGHGTGMTSNNSVDILRLDTGAWTAGPAMSASVGEAKVVAVGGDRFLRVAGTTTAANHTSTVQEYDVSAGVWTAKQALPVNRGLHVAALLSNGKVLVAGGNASGWDESHVRNYLYTQGSPGSWAETGNFVLQTENFRAVKLADGKVLRCGGYSTLSSAVLRDCFRFNPATGGWDTVGKLATGRQDFSLTLLPDGRVLAVGGRTDNSTAVTNTAELYDPATGVWSTTGSFTNARRHHKAILLADGLSVLLTGGNNGNTTGGTYFTNAQLYSIAAGTWSAAGTMNAARGNHAIARLNDGRVFVAGGFDGATTNSSSETYDPGTNLWTARASMNSGHSVPAFGHVGSGANERVYLAGGFQSSGGSVTNVTEYYDVTLNTWTSVANLPDPRWAAGNFVSEDGFLYVFGGTLNSVASGVPTPLVHRYDIAGNTWTAITSLTGENSGNVNYSYDGAILLDDGRVLIPGMGNAIRSSELYSFVTTREFVATGGDLNHTFTLTGIGTYYPACRTYVPHSADFSARGGPGSTATELLLEDGEGETATSDITIP